MKGEIYKVILEKEHGPQRARVTEYQYGILFADNCFDAEEKAMKEFKRDWEPEGWRWHGIFHESKKPLETGILWI